MNPKRKVFMFYTGFEKMERGLSEKYHDRVSPVKRHMDHMVSIGAAPGLINPQLNTMTSDVVKVRDCQNWRVRYIFNSGALATQRAARTEPHRHHGNPWIHFLVVIVASDIACGRIRTMMTTTTTEWRKMAAIAQLIGKWRNTALAYSILLSYWASMLWSIDNRHL